ncbi:DNA-processing protein DprA [Paramagnetospirillum magneticum]|uniref:Predicted Rossmann fold nucleotide-binding protein n=1 Tax=Paramagnetospirillum magneticum (strain ATCC 700264 / AMB-1) TaxID=342108 RepID=Q2W9J0_PARM1|nr:DNA-processing protein DprA [Paramagnetospirillum magneticum]BAE49485.1 Predicted Rossmann fold nucleotide-binding protein [Paramagnetospirillum magneticum AMB-1]
MQPATLHAMDEGKRQLSAAERFDWLRLIRSENVGPRTFSRLLERFGSASAALAALPDLARKGGARRPIRICPKADAEREMEATGRVGARLLGVAEPGYPAWLAALDDAPPLLCVLGNPSVLAKPMVAMVGARNASLNGRNFARRLAADLGRAGYVVASGMARGIDTAAHQGALASGTVAVLAGGVDVVYPPENTDLWREIGAAGAVVSEMPVGTQPQASYFPRRNRIISGLSLGVVVVEANARSGSLITARFAADQGREVFAVPGSPMDPRAAGPNDLLRHGATLTESVADVTDVLGDLLRRPLAEGKRADFRAPQPVEPDTSEMDQARARVAEALGPAPVMVDEIIRQCQLSPSMVSWVLLEIELAGRLERHPGNRVSLLVG